MIATSIAKACLSTQIMDLNGWVYLKGISPKNSDLKSMSRRINRVGTLDTNVYFDDQGFTHGDRTIAIQLKVTEAEWDTISNIIQNHPLIWFTTSEGAFTAAIESASLRENNASLRILIKSTA